MYIYIADISLGEYTQYKKDPTRRVSITSLSFESTAYK